MSEKGNFQERGSEKEPSYTKKITAYPWETTLDQIDALARQRHREQPADLQRLSMYIGCLFISIQGERGPDGNYGLWSAHVIQEQIRSWITIGADWLTEQGHPLHFTGAENSNAITTALMAALLNGRGEGTPALSDLFSMNAGAETQSTTLPLAEERSASTPREGARDFMLDASTEGDLNLEGSVIL